MLSSNIFNLYEFSLAEMFFVKVIDCRGNYLLIYGNTFQPNINLGFLFNFRINTPFSAIVTYFLGFSRSNFLFKINLDYLGDDTVKDIVYIFFFFLLSVDVL